MIKRTCDRCGVDVAPKFYSSVAIKRTIDVPAAAPFTAGAPTPPVTVFSTTILVSEQAHDLCEPCFRGAVLAMAASFTAGGPDALTASIAAVQAAQAVLEAQAAVSAQSAQVQPNVQVVP